MGDVREALDESVAAATHLGSLDAGAVAAARALADKIDCWDTIVDWAMDDAVQLGDGRGRPAVPANDNTSLPTFLRYCEALGLTPGSRGDVKPKEAGTGGRLTVLRDQARQNRAG